MTTIGSDCAGSDIPNRTAIVGYSGATCSATWLYWHIVTISVHEREREREWDRERDSQREREYESNKFYSTVDYCFGLGDKRINSDADHCHICNLELPHMALGKVHKVDFVWFGIHIH